ncbi:MAG: DUF1858 domain-containing protein [Acidimicrobiia bacterium]|nr:DUF1858 domain-containing protein [Acidimicrobiia bacterium]MDH5505032.1 DUF1858 domain-containing protein [Acidimicrobiia bacterium]
MDITKDTKVSEILKEYGDIAAVMETFGIKRVAGYDIRKFVTKAITVEWAARIHRVPLDEFLTTLRTAVGESPEP